MRVAFDLTSETGVPGGIATYWSALVDRLARRYPADEWTLVGARDLQVADALARHANVRFRALGEKCGGAVRRRWRQQFRLPRELAGGGFDLVHSVNNVLPLAARLPRVVTIHDWTARHVPRRFGALKRLFLDSLIPRSALAADFVIVGSESTRQDLTAAVRGLVAERIAVIPHGIDARFHPAASAGEGERLRSRFDLPARFALFVGALEPGKNVAAILAAQRILGGEGAAPGGAAPPPLVIAGGRGWGGGWEEVRAAARAAAPIRVLGRVPDEDLPALYRAARVFLFPSLWEGFGFPVLEAMACGTPVLTSNVSSLPEIAGDAALLIDPGSAADLARAWGALWRDDAACARLRALGLERAKRYSWGRAAEETHAVYESMLMGARARTREEPVPA
ncbi:MAG: glycosyltransferase family 4 protein [Planctomycetes bacterium]|nr:glycosyltransferase family 4 protein [Planctomycetota bacterium]